MNKTELFETMPLAKAICKLAIPTIMSSLVMVLYNLTDTYFVGLINDPIQNAAVTLIAPVLLAFNAINNLFGVGTSSMMSRALGRKDNQTVTLCSATGFYCAATCAFCFSILCLLFRTPLLQLLGTSSTTWTAANDYFKWTVIVGEAPAILNVVFAYLVRAEGFSMHASIRTMSGCFLNMLLDPLFILPWGLNMGAAGAGLATCLSNMVACLYFLVLHHKQKGSTKISLNPHHISKESHIIKEICMVGLPASIQNLLNVTGMTVLNNFASGFGSNAIAAMGISHKINMIPLQIALGLSQGIMPLVSYNYASGNYRRMKQAVKLAMGISSGFLILLTMLYFGFSSNLMRLFIQHQEVIAYGSTFLKRMCMALPFLGIDFLAVGFFQATGMGKKALQFAILRKIILEIPALFLLNQLFPLVGLAMAQGVTEFIMALIAGMTLYRLFALYPNSPRLDQN